MELQLGDIIRLHAKTHENLNENLFFISYIDLTHIKLINTDTTELVQLNIKDGIIQTPEITEIDILSRADFPEYSKQNGLIPGKWINIIFLECMKSTPTFSYT